MQNITKDRKCTKDKETHKRLKRTKDKETAALLVVFDFVRDEKMHFGIVYCEK